MSVIGPDGTVWPAGSLRAIEHESIRRFVQQAADDGFLKGRVLDYGCGYAPYREIVEKAGGEWLGYDQAGFPDNHVGDVGLPLPSDTRYDGVLLTQVIQYSFYPEEFLLNIRDYTIADGGHLILSYPTNWPEAQPEDLFRFTASGIEYLLVETGFTVIRHESRASISWAGETFSLGGGVIARA